MRAIIYKFYRFSLPFFLRYFIWNIIQKKQKNKIKKKILKYFSKENPSRELFLNEIEYLEKNELTVLPYSDIQSTKNKIKVYTDDTHGLKYVFFENKRIYFKRSMNSIEIKSYFKELLKEQHLESPHRYLSNKFNIERGSIVADIGVAEGIFSLSIIDHVSFIYLFDPDLEWIEALNITFSPWKSKIKIISKYVSDITGPNTLALDDYFNVNANSVDFLKIDVDGAELNLLNGSKNLLRTPNKLKIAICTYHNQGDEQKFSKIMKDNNFDFSPTDRYMLFHFDENFTPPYFRRGVLRAIKSQ